MAVPILRAPFPWFGGKSRAAHLVWSAFGDVPNYVEPFAGSLAVLLGRPTAARIETVNDKDAYLSNFWRAVSHDPAGVAEHADWPVNEVDLHARHLWLIHQDVFRERMLTEPDFYDVKVAGWWVWGLSAWLGSGWCAGGGNLGRFPTSIREESTVEATASRQHGRAGSSPKPPPRRDRSHSSGMRGVASIASGSTTQRRRTGHQSSPPRSGVALTPSRQLPELYFAKGLHSSAFGGSFDDLCARLRRVRVVCGDWSRVVTDSVTVHLGTTGILLDPPYADGARVYSEDDASLSVKVREWAIANGERKELRIAYCSYGEQPVPDGWVRVKWKAKGGYGNTRKGVDKNMNADRESIDLSPHCLPVVAAQGSLFGADIK